MVLYGEGLRMQGALAECVHGGGPDQLLLLEHNPVYTLGRNATRADIHVPDAFLAENGIEVHQVDRGGQVTYHGPGQIVAYPICNLRGQSVSKLVNGLEQAMIETAKGFGVHAERLEGHPGIWVETARGWEKLGAIGLHLKKWVSTHGLAFNLAPRMEHYQWITACGIADKGVCSLKTLLGDACPSWVEASTSLERHLLNALELEPLPAVEPSRSVSITVWRRGAKGPEILMAPRHPHDDDQWQSGVTDIVEPGETFEAAAKGIMDETGLHGRFASLDFSHTHCNGPAPAPGHEPSFNTEACFHLEVMPDATVRLNKAERSRWCPPEEAMSLMAQEGGREAIRLLMLN